MEFALILGTLMLGLAGAPHCAAMCGPTCAALQRSCGRQAPQATMVSFHLARLLGYAATGAVAASSVGALARLGEWSPALRPFWTLLHVAALGLGLWLLWQGRQPAWLENLGRGAGRLAPQQPDAQGWQRMQGPVRASAAGLAWVAWPCGLLQSALLMAAFAAASALGLSLAPWAFARLSGLGGSAAVRVNVWAVRLAGATLAAASAWALGHDLFRRVVAYCLG